VGQMRWVWAGLLAMGIHLVVSVLAQFPTIERRVEVEDWDLLISFRTDPPPLFETRCMGDMAVWRDHAIPVDEVWWDEFLLPERWRAAQEEGG